MTVNNNIKDIELRSNLIINPVKDIDDLYIYSHEVGVYVVDKKQLEK